MASGRLEGPFATVGAGSTSDLENNSKPRVGMLDTRAYQELEPLRLPSKLRERITKAQRRAAAEKDGVSIFTANAPALSFRGNEKDPIDNTAKSEGWNGTQARSSRRLYPADSCNAPTPSKEKMHLPDVVLGHKMREFEAKMNVNALFVDPLENNLHHLSIEDKERVMLKMQEKIQAITAQVNAHYIQLKEELNGNGIFDSAANSQRAQALCLVELQKRCKLEKIRDDALREVLREDEGDAHVATSHMEGRLNQLFEQKQHDADEITQTAVRRVNLLQNTKSFAAKRRPAVRKHQLSPVRKTVLYTSNQKNHESVEDRGGRSSRGIEDPQQASINYSSTNGGLPNQEDWRSQHPHIVQALQMLAANGGVVVATASTADTLDTYSSRGNGVDGCFDECQQGVSTKVKSVAEEWAERSVSYQTIAGVTCDELVQRFSRWRWDSTNHFHNQNAPLNGNLLLSKALMERIRRSRGTASARLSEEEERQRALQHEENSVQKRRKAEAVYQQLQDTIRARREEAGKRSPARIQTRESTAGSQMSASRPNAMSTPSIATNKLDPQEQELSKHSKSISRREDQPQIDENPRQSVSLLLRQSASAPLLGHKDDEESPTRNTPNRSVAHDVRRSILERKLPALLNKEKKRGRMRIDSRIGAPILTDMNTLGHHSNARIEERRSSAQTWAWYHPQTTSHYRPENLPEGDTGDDDSDVDDSELRDGLGNVREESSDNDEDEHEDGDENDSDDSSEDDARSTRSSLSSMHAIDSARSSFSVMSKRLGHLGELPEEVDRRGTKGPNKISKAKRHGHSHQGRTRSPSVRGTSNHRGPRGSHRLSRPSVSSTASGSSGGMFAGIHFTANAQVLQHRLEEVWRVLEFPFSAKLLMLEKYAFVQDGDALGQALTQWEGVVEMVLVREKLKHILSEFEAHQDLKSSSQLTPSEWSYLLMQQVEIPPNAISLSVKDLVYWIQSHMDSITLQCEKMGQHLKATTGDELFFQGVRYPPRV